MTYNPETAARYREKNRVKAVRYRAANKLKSAKYDHDRRLKLKIIVLTEYGKDHTLQCCWDNCPVIDVDMLTLDHIYNNGKADRANKGGKGGYIFYAWLKNRNYPAGYQTLCWNHQWKKEITHRRRRHAETNN
jgi:hypothetical protein